MRSDFSGLGTLLWFTGIFSRPGSWISGTALSFTHWNKCSVNIFENWRYFHTWIAEHAISSIHDVSLSTRISLLCHFSPPLSHSDLYLGWPLAVTACNIYNRFQNVSNKQRLWDLWPVQVLVVIYDGKCSSAYHPTISVNKLLVKRLMITLLTHIHKLCWHTYF